MFRQVEFSGVLSVEIDQAPFVFVDGAGSAVPCDAVENSFAVGRDGDGARGTQCGKIVEAEWMLVGGEGRG